MIKRAIQTILKSHFVILSYTFWTVSFVSYMYGYLSLMKVKWSVVCRNEQLIACTAVKLDLKLQKAYRYIIKIQIQWRGLDLGVTWGGKTSFTTGPWAVKLLTLLKSWQLLAAKVEGTQTWALSADAALIMFAFTQQHSNLHVALSVLRNIHRYLRRFESACLHSFWHWLNSLVNSAL